MTQKTGGFTLIEVMIIVAVIGILTVIGIPGILRSRTSANDVMAQATLKNISNALESYLTINSSYPAAIDELTTATPPYINKDYFIGTFSGFTYTSTVSPYSYMITASPVNPGQSGTTTFTISTGGAISG